MSYGVPLGIPYSAAWLQLGEAVNKAMEGVTKDFTSMMKKIMEPIQKRAEEAEQKSLEEVAKKYELLGTKAEELVPVLKSMKATTSLHPWITTLR